MNPSEFYRAQIDQCETQLSRLKRILFLTGMLRLSIFLVVVAIVWFLNDHFTIVTTTIVAGLVLFLIAVAKNEDFKRERKRLRLLKKLNEHELKISAADWTGVPTGQQHITEGHHFNQDIDLFGEGSLFQWVNRTATRSGEKVLAKWLNSNDIDDVEEKQASVKFMASIPKWRQEFQTEAGMIENPVENEVIAERMLGYQSKIPKVFSKLWLVFSVISVVVISLYIAELMTLGVLLTWFFLNLGITLIYLRKITQLTVEVGKLSETIGQYGTLLKQIEELPEGAPKRMMNQKARLNRADQTASTIIQLLAKQLGQLDQRNNIFFAFIANGFFMWDLRHSAYIEDWLEKHSKDTVEWFQVISEFEALLSLGGYAYNHPAFIYPEISTDQTLMSAEELAHPLIKPTSRIANDFSIETEDFYIITGANMAGKSTFLRTVALNLVMANNGLPVCATQFKYRPIRLISSMRTSDSLKNDESYFFSELKRLKFIVEALKADDYFIILDEILKGTNSKDKAEGSQKFVEKLVRTKSAGLIATHDLSLCTLADELEEVENYYFDALIENDELSFDYRLKKGICQNMNASFLLRKMEIVD